jgi:hypothetical protein
MKAQCYESGGRILLGDNAGGGLIPRPVSFQCVWSLDFNRTPLYMDVQLTVCILSSHLRRIFWHVGVASVWRVGCGEGRFTRIVLPSCTPTVLNVLSGCTCALI